MQRVWPHGGASGGWSRCLPVEPPIEATDTGPDSSRKYARHVSRNGRPPASLRARPPISGILLAPGAGASADQPAFVAFADAVAQSGLVVERMDFPYRLAGRRRPDPPAVLEATVRTRAAELAHRLGVSSDQLLLGGRSMGGRICSQAVAAGLGAGGLVLVSYPLHPPGRPERLRTAHFSALDVPCLFVSGSKDTFADPSELESATRAVPGHVTHVWIDGADHGLGRHVVNAAEAVVRWIEETFSPHVPGTR